MSEKKDVKVNVKKGNKDNAQETRRKWLRYFKKLKTDYGKIVVQGKKGEYLIMPLLKLNMRLTKQIIQLMSNIWIAVVFCYFPVSLACISWCSSF